MRLNFHSFFYLLCFFLIYNPHAIASEKNSTTVEKSAPESRFEICLVNTIRRTDKTQKITLAEIESECEQAIVRKVLKKESNRTIELGALSHRLIRESRTAADPYILTAHKLNYILPFSVVNHVNRSAYKDYSTWEDELKAVEATFQISLKIPLLTGNFITEGDQLHFGFTLKSWWQIYTENLSKPFRETNYQPEIFYLTPIDFHPFGGNSALVVGVEHQSNGQSQLLSRSWNRFYVNYLYEKRNFALSIRPWYRIPENEKSSPDSGQGDDNPDIIDYMGHFELGMAYKYSNDLELHFRGRNNLATHKGYVQVGATFPLWGKLKGYTQLSSGYGESLIDYNVNQKRFGIGIALTTLL